ncbi:nucleotidyltransferase family protein [Verrucomicrobia bacterium]|nr:nucleotidyltransferase family protein [Verrucomicrobiota bacterium]
MRNFTEHLIPQGTRLKVALVSLNKLGEDAIVFIVGEQRQLIGSLTDGDVRRGLLKNFTTDDRVEAFLKPNPKFIRKDRFSIKDIIELRKNKFLIIPVINCHHEVVNVLNFRFLRSYLPFDAVIMAGGKGSRLKPLTNNIPKPLLKVGNKTIIDHGLDRLRQFGVDDFWISLNHLGEQIEAHFGDGKARGVNINYIREEKPLGTIGAVGHVKEFQHDYVLVTNSDILTNINYEDFFLEFLKTEADMAVVSIPYEVNVPYAVLETSGNQILSFTEKPTFTYHSNGGIYLIKRKMLEHIPVGKVYNSTDLMQKLILEGHQVISYPMVQYWLDIGKPCDYEKAQEDINHIYI